jgi:hypothetical protein
MKTASVILILCAIMFYSLGNATADVCTVNPNNTPALQCKDPTQPKCVLYPVAGWKCMPRNATACGIGKITWYCLPPTPNCNGDGTSMPRCR